MGPNNAHRHITLTITYSRQDNDEEYPLLLTGEINILQIQCKIDLTQHHDDHHHNHQHHRHIPLTATYSRQDNDEDHLDE